MSDKLHHTIETVKNDAKDLVDEAKERTQATIHGAKADIDAAKRDVRHAADKPAPDKV
jgi:vacuolar-type H+-ATPase subunit H